MRIGNGAKERVPGLCSAVMLCGVILSVVMASGSASAADKRAPAPPPLPKADKDCTPINGRSGYYGNPWCDTGSYRLEDIWLRENRASARRYLDSKSR